MRLSRRAVPAAVAVLVGLVALTGCAPPSSVTFSGRGYGHGRGMGQWGAYGYAVDQGKDWRWILDHFYGGTSTVPRPGAADPDQRVWMRANSGRDLVVEQPRARYKLGGVGTTRMAVRIKRADSTRWQVFDGDSCSGPWTARPALVTAAEVAVVPTNPGEDRDNMLRLCEASGKRLLRGALLAVHVGSSIETVSRVSTEDMIRTVVAREMSPSWADAGGGKGINALAAQAVAARSYVSAGDNRWGSWATTCDGGNCQTYSGVAYAPSGGSWQVYEDRRTDLSVSMTTGLVRTFPSSGKIAATEFGASTGGYTKGPTFTPVPDEGDATSANPNHTWTATLSAATIESRFDARQGTDLGAFGGVVVVSRDGRGADGGRPTSVRFDFANASVTVTGDQARQALGLKSDWFTPTANP
ncbi:MAG: SpoIID/LytB domain protein [Acidimicrobiales bacterium]|nr:SpoIID/LytB domain protein [Acidimicrobiales bacterium]